MGLALTGDDGHAGINGGHPAGGGHLRHIRVGGGPHDGLVVGGVRQHGGRQGHIIAGLEGVFALLESDFLRLLLDGQGDGGVAAGAVRGLGGDDGVALAHAGDHAVGIHAGVVGAVRGPHHALDGGVVRADDGVQHHGFAHIEALDVAAQANAGDRLHHQGAEGLVHLGVLHALHSHETLAGAAAGEGGAAGPDDGIIRGSQDPLAVGGVGRLAGRGDGLGLAHAQQHDRQIAVFRVGVQRIRHQRIPGLVGCQLAAGDLNGLHPAGDGDGQLSRPGTLGTLKGGGDGGRTLGQAVHHAVLVHRGDLLVGGLEGQIALLRAVALADHDQLQVLALKDGIVILVEVEFIFRQRGTAHAAHEQDDGQHQGEQSLHGSFLRYQSRVSSI